MLGIQPEITPADIGIAGRQMHRFVACLGIGQKEADSLDEKSENQQRADQKKDPSGASFFRNYLIPGSLLRSLSSARRRLSCLSGARLSLTQHQSRSIFTAFNLQLRGVLVHKRPILIIFMFLLLVRVASPKAVASPSGDQDFNLSD